MNRKLENALRKRIQRKFGHDIFVCSTFLAEMGITIFVNRKEGVQSSHRVWWCGDFAAFDHAVRTAITHV